MKGSDGFPASSGVAVFTWRKRDCSVTSTRVATDLVMRSDLVPRALRRFGCEEPGVPLALTRDRGWITVAGVDARRRAVSEPAVNLSLDSQPRTRDRYREHGLEVRERRLPGRNFFREARGALRGGLTRFDHGPVASGIEQSPDPVVGKVGEAQCGALAV